MYSRQENICLNDDCQDSEPKKILEISYRLYLLINNIIRKLVREYVKLNCS